MVSNFLRTLKELLMQSVNDCTNNPLVGIRQKSREKDNENKSGFRMKVTNFIEFF